MLVPCLTLSAKLTAKEITNCHHVLGIRIFLCVNLMKHMAFIVPSGKFIQIMSFISQLFYFTGVKRVEATFAKDVCKMSILDA